MEEDNILMKDLTPEQRTKLELNLLKEGIIPNICEGPNGFATMIIPADENTKLSGAAAALLPFQDSQSEEDRLIAAKLCADQILNIALILQRITEEKYTKMEEQDQVANAILQRALSFHISNIKLTLEGICLKSNSKFQIINDNYKAIPLTRSVYELLVTFFGLFIQNKTEEAKKVAFNCWKINSEKNALGNFGLTGSRIEERQTLARQTIEECKKIIFSTEIGHILHSELEEYLSGEYSRNGTLFFIKVDNKWKKKNLSFSSAWKYMCTSDINLEFQYRMLSMHSHPIHWGLSLFVNQNKDSISDAIAGLHFSSIFLAKLSSYYIQHFDFKDINTRLTAHQQGILESMTKAT